MANQIYLVGWHKKIDITFKTALSNPRPRINQILKFKSSSVLGKYFVHIHYYLGITK